MGELAMSEGILRNLFQNMRFGGVTISPQLANNEIVINLTQEELKQMLLANADARAKNAVTIELHEGKLTLRIKLW